MGSDMKQLTLGLHPTRKRLFWTLLPNLTCSSVEAHVKMIQRGLREADMLITTGGTSMGSSDLLKPVIERELNGTIHFGRVSVKPGKPTTFATTNFEGKDKAIFALPGNPASALVCFYVFVLPALRSMGGWSWSRSQLPRIKVKVSLAFF
jgi:gephyrin